ncbi:hypothetical protein BGZ63DRAFT_394704 [Mariannaea sp. PMI_226]|nr:hypothetical protein BGZ63DRAFT_394704 [Mariannaea sp. PMI_226]
MIRVVFLFLILLVYYFHSTVQVDCICTRHLDIRLDSRLNRRLSVSTCEYRHNGHRLVSGWLATSKKSRPPVCRLLDLNRNSTYSQVPLASRGSTSHDVLASKRMGKEVGERGLQEHHGGNSLGGEG